MKKKLALAMAACMLVGSLTGCGGDKGPSKADLEKELNILDSNLSAERKKTDELAMIIAGYNPNDSAAADVTKFYQMAVDKGAYFSFNDKINMANPIEVTPVREIQDQTLLKITDYVQFKPNQNWTIQAGSGHAEMSHSSGIYGEVDCYEYMGGSTGSKVYDDYIKPHLEAIKGEAVGVPSNIFLANGELAGKQATVRLKVAKLQNGDLAVQKEEMTKPHSEESLSEESVAEGSVEETTEASAEASSEESAEASSESVEGEASAESTESVDPIAEGETAAIEDGELTGEVVEQSEEDTIVVEDYLYTVAVAIYPIESSLKQTIVFKFMYKEGDAADVATKSEFVNSTIKSFAINGNSLTLQ